MTKLRKLTYKEWMFLKIRSFPKTILKGIKQDIVANAVLGIVVGGVLLLFGVLITLVGAYMYGVPLLVFGFFLWTYSEYRDAYRHWRGKYE